MESFEFGAHDDATPRRITSLAIMVSSSVRRTRTLVRLASVEINGSPATFRPAYEELVATLLIIPFGLIVWGLARGGGILARVLGTTPLRRLGERPVLIGCCLRFFLVQPLLK